MPQHISPQDKKHIKCLFVTKLQSTKSLYDFGLMTDDFIFYQCEIRTVYKDITSDLWLKLRHTFLPFQFDKNTDVIITNNISVYEPIAFYLKILQEQIHFNMRFVAIDQIPRRIATYHNTYVKKNTVKNITMRDLNSLWAKILKYEKCPWITTEIDRTLNDSYPAYAKRMKFLRLGVYYMLVKQHLYLKYKNSVSYKRKQCELSKIVNY